MCILTLRQIYPAGKFEENLFFYLDFNEMITDTQLTVNVITDEG